MQLFDDGAHSDGAAGDKTYGNTWDSTGAEEGLYYVDIVSWDALNNREEAENLATFTINAAPPVEEEVFDTGEGTYPSISGTHNGTITPSHNLSVSKLYTYPDPCTGGHIEYARIYNVSGTIAEAYWNGYIGDWHNLTFNNTFTLHANESYNFTIRTDSYPQIIHEREFNTTGGTITCTKFTDTNGRAYYDWIPALKLF